MFSLVILCSFACLIQADDARICLTSEDRLFHDLVDTYDAPSRYTRPVKDHNETLRVCVGLALININSFDEESGIGEFLFWDRYSWHDDRLTWNPEHYDGISVIRIPSELIWTPDIVPYNSLWSKESDHISDTLAVAYHDGSVLYIPRHIRKLRCKEQRNVLADDEFECRIKVGSWVYDGFLLDLDFYEGAGKIDISDYMGDPTHITKNTAVKDIKYYECCKEPYPSITFTFKFSDDEVEDK